jgi:hypothetical protein
MTKWVSHPFGVVRLELALSNPYPKSIPRSPKAGIKMRTPAPAERFELKGLNSLKLLNPFPASKKVNAYMEALGFKVIG